MNAEEIEKKAEAQRDLAVDRASAIRLAHVKWLTEIRERTGGTPSYYGPEVESWLDGYRAALTDLLSGEPDGWAFEYNSDRFTFSKLDDAIIHRGAMALETAESISIIPVRIIEMEEKGK